MSVDTHAVSDTELLAMFSESIPCERCGKSAQLRSDGHGEGECGGPIYSCYTCWQVWAERELEKKHANGGYHWHVACQQKFYTLAEFSDYREF